MKQFIIRARMRTLAATALLLALGLPIYQNAPASLADTFGSTRHVSLTASPESGLFIIYEDQGAIGCRDASAEEAATLRQRDPNLKLHRISPISLQSLNVSEPGLKIILRATEQLEGFPEAKAAFLKAAAIWEERIETPITIVVDVDYGPKRFGKDYPRGVLGSTDSQHVGDSEAFAEVRAGLLSGASSPEETAIYNSLPQSTVPTDLGDSTFMIGPATTFRALGALPPIANPDAEKQQLGDPPSIGFNSSFQFDFNPGDGIDPGRFDFEAIAVHEIGHVLGFSSNSGFREIESRFPIATTVWDLFRLRPNTPLEGFSTAKRILSSGDEQRFFAAGLELPLSTGRPDGTGGDGEQPSHWKDDFFISRYIGIMDPTIARGERQVITANDLIALETMGYKIRGGLNLAPEIGNVTADLRGDTLTLRGGAVDLDRDLSQAQVFLLDGTGRVLTQLPLASINAGAAAIVSFNIQFSGLSQIPAATQASVAVIDSSNRRTPMLTASLLGGDADGPTLSSATFDGSKLAFKGKKLTGSLQIEINGVVVAPPLNIKIKGVKKVQVSGSASELNLRSGTNRVRAISDGLRSNIISVSL